MSRLTLALVLLCFTWQISCVCRALADESEVSPILRHNSDRRTSSRVHSAFIYLLITLGYVCLASLLAVFMGWLWQPFAPLLQQHSKDHLNDESLTKRSTLIWEIVVLILVAFMGLGGLPGWCVLGFLFLVAAACIALVAAMASRSRAKVVAVEEDPEGGAGGPKQADNWTQHPHGLGKYQIRLAILTSVLMVAFLIVVLIIFYAWTVAEYKLWYLGQGAEEKSYEITEYIPGNTGKALAMMYSWNGLASDLRYSMFAKIATSYCGTAFTKKLTTEEEKRDAIFTPFVELYNIDMSIFKITDWRDFDSANAWFIREIDPNARIPRTEFKGQLASPADSRMLIFPALEDSKVWIKGSRFNYVDLIDDASLAKRFEGGSMVIARLAPQDYHRFNSPADGTITYVNAVDGGYWSVNPDAVTSANNAFYNLRKVVMIETADMGTIAYIAIGATCVGSVILNANIKPGETLALGDELGFMQFGGSTVILLLEKGAVNYHPQILANSAISGTGNGAVETYVKVNQCIGQSSAGLAATQGSCRACITDVPVVSN